MTNYEMTNFLENGAFIRENDIWSLAILGSERAITDVRTHYPDLPGLYVMDFFAENQNFFKFVKIYTISGVQLLEILNTYLNFSIKNINSKNSFDSTQHYQKIQRGFEKPSRSEFQLDIQKIHHEINHGQLLKAVPITFEVSEGTVNPIEKAIMIKNLIMADQTLNPFGFWKNNKGILGASPEVLFKKINNEYETMALAGTRARFQGEFENSEDSLLNDSKEIFEHQKVIEDIENILSDFSDFKKDKTEVIKLPQLIHLKTLFKFKLKKKLTMFELTQMMHPTSALGIFPRLFEDSKGQRHGFEWLKQLSQANQRGQFGAPFVWQHSNDHITGLVSIRQIQWNAQQAQLGAGCGIVKASHTDQEWNEVQAKRDSIKKILGIQDIEKAI